MDLTDGLVYGHHAKPSCTQQTLPTVGKRPDNQLSCGGLVLPRYSPRSSLSFVCHFRRPHNSISSERHRRQRDRLRQGDRRQDSRPQRHCCCCCCCSRLSDCHPPWTQPSVYYAYITSILTPPRRDASKEMPCRVGRIRSSGDRCLGRVWRRQESEKRRAGVLGIHEV